jgi:branched-chain amino acid transport system substrate-binding protein
LPGAHVYYAKRRACNALEQNDIAYITKRGKKQTIKKGENGMRKSTKKVLAIMITIFMALSLFACSGDTTDVGTPGADTTTPQATEDTNGEDKEPAANLEPIKIGHIADMTGVESMVGKQADEALNYALKAIGAEIAGRPVEIILGDSQSNPSVAVDVAKKMIEHDGVVAILGPTQIGHKSAVAEYITDAERPVIFYNPTPIFLAHSNPWIVGAGGATPQMPSVMGDYAYNELGYRKVHTIAMDNTGGRSYIDPFAQTFTELGGTILQQQWAPVPTPDFSPYLVSLGEADALCGWTSSSDAIALWSAWSDLGLNDKLPIVATMHGGMTDYFIGAALENSNPEAAKAFEGALAPMMYVYDIDTPENEEFVAGWVEEFGKIPGGTNLPGATYQALLLLKTAIESIDGETDPHKLIKAIFEADFRGPEGHLFFDNSQAATKDLYIVQVVKMDDGSYNYKRIKTYSDVGPQGMVY